MNGQIMLVEPVRVHMPTENALRKPSHRMTKVLADNIRRYRKARGISQEEFADLCQLHRTYIGSVERGERNVTLSTLEAIADAMGIRVSDLLTESNERID